MAGARASEADWHVVVQAGLPPTGTLVVVAQPLCSEMAVRAAMYAKDVIVEIAPVE